MYRSMKWSVIHKCLIGCLVGLGFYFNGRILEFIGIRVLSQSEVYVQKVTSGNYKETYNKKRILTKMINTIFWSLRILMDYELLSLQGDESIDIAFLGDSNIFGWGVDDHETYDAQLQKKMPQLKVLNAGQPGHSSFQSYELFTEYLPMYKPKWTILVLSMHDHNQTPISDVERSGSVHGIIPRVRLFCINIYEYIPFLEVFSYRNTKSSRCYRRNISCSRR